MPDGAFAGDEPFPSETGNVRSVRCDRKRQGHGKDPGDRKAETSEAEEIPAQQAAIRGRQATDIVEEVFAEISQRIEGRWLLILEVGFRPVDHRERDEKQRGGSHQAAEEPEIRGSLKADLAT